jgi:hypothetical protein
MLFNSCEKEIKEIKEMKSKMMADFVNGDILFILKKITIISE